MHLEKRKETSKLKKFCELNERRQDGDGTPSQLREMYVASDSEMLS